jgi:hypothetical protein
VSNANQPSTNPDDNEKARHEAATVQTDVSEPHNELTEVGKGIAMTLPLWGLSGIVAWLWWKGWF